MNSWSFLRAHEGPIEPAAVSAIVTAASGGVTDLKTILAMTTGDMKNAFVKAGTVAASFTPPARTLLNAEGHRRKL